MKSGARGLGIAESYDGSADDDDRSVLCGALVRADRALDDLVFGSCAVGGLDATAGVIDLVDRLDRPDAGYLLLAGIAPAWFNLIDLDAVRAATDLPALSVSFEASPGLEGALREQFDGDALAERLAIYRSLPPRRPVAVNGERVFVRAVGLDPDRAAAVVRGFTPEGGRPEPLRAARLGARAGRRWRAVEKGR